VLETRVKEVRMEIMDRVRILDTTVFVVWESKRVGVKETFACAVSGLR
jgi:hypothetical protein